MALTISEVARAAAVNVQTIRYYERRGLFPKPSRTRSGYRQYDEDAVHRLRFVKQAQRLGFTLEEVRQLLTLRDHDQGTCEAVQDQLRRKIAGLDQKLHELEHLRQTLVGLVDDCLARSADDECPMLESLEEGAA